MKSMSSENREDFVRQVSFAGPGEAIDFGAALAACVRLTGEVCNQGQR